jgi:hypothetical protein
MLRGSNKGALVIKTVLLALSWRFLAVAAELMAQADLHQ